MKSRWLDNGHVLLFALLQTRHKVKVNKNAKKESGQYPVILTKQAWSIKDLSYSKNILLYIYKSRVTNLFEEPGKKANCVCSTMHPQELFMISILTTSATFCNSMHPQELFMISILTTSATFCNSIAEIAQKL